MEQAELLRRVIDVLEERKITYLLVGSLASGVYGELSYYREGGSEKHLRDVAAMLQVNGEEIDTAYVDDWSGRLGLVEEWQMVLARLRERP